MAPRRHGGHHGGVFEFSSIHNNNISNNNLHPVTTGGYNGSSENLSSLIEQNSTTHCCIPNGECVRSDEPIWLNALQDVVKVVCNNDNCTAGQFMHRECFDAWEQTILTHLKTCGRARSWSERQRQQNLWTKKGYDLAFKACGCRCGRGHLKKDLDWVATSANMNGNRQDENEAKKKKRRNKQLSRPSLGESARLQSHNHASHAVAAPIADSNRGRTGSLSSSNGSSSPPATSEPSVSPLHQPQTLMKKKNKVDFTTDRMRQSCGANGIFSRRLDFSAFNSLPRTKLNSYHIKAITSSNQFEISLLKKRPVLKCLFVAYGLMAAQQLCGINVIIFYSVYVFDLTGVQMDSLVQSVILAAVQVFGCLVSAVCVDKMEDEGNHGNDDTRCFILSTLAALQWSKVACILCRATMLVFDRYPLVDGTFFLSPKQHSFTCAEVKVDGRTQYLTAVCMSCVEGSGTPARCRFCMQPWDGSSLVLGTAYSYDVFAAMPCCTERLKCNNCQKPLIHPYQRLHYYSDYSRVFACPHCRVMDAHFVKNLSTCFTREQFQLSCQWP